MTSWPLSARTGAANLKRPPLPEALKRAATSATLLLSTGPVDGGWLEPCGGSPRRQGMGGKRMARKVIGPTGSRRRRWLFLCTTVLALAAAAFFIAGAGAVVNG